jgi:hypothetical protein
MPSVYSRAAGALMSLSNQMQSDLAVKVQAVATELLQARDGHPPVSIVESTGRRRCGISEHRRQIRAFQKSHSVMQRTMYDAWRRASAAETECNRLRALLSTEQARTLVAGRWIVGATLAGAAIGAAAIAVVLV